MTEEINYDDLAETPVAITDDEIKSIAELAERQIKIEDWIEHQEARLKEAKKNLAKVTGELLPDAMRQAGVKEFTLENGCELKLDVGLRANITKANHEWCMNWIAESGNGSIIRNKFDLSFGADEHETAEALATYLEEQGFDFNQKTNIPWNTLDAFVRTEVIENEPGEEWEKRFGVYRPTSVKIVRPKA